MIVVFRLAPEPLKAHSDGRARFNSLDSRALLGASVNMGFSKTSTASDPERTPRPTHPQRSFTPDSLREACRAPSPPPPRSTTPASTLSGFLAPSSSSSGGVKEQGSIALRAIRSVKSLARVGGWSQLGVNENGTKEGPVKEKKEKKKELREGKENRDGTLREKRDRKEKKDKKDKREKDKREKKEKKERKESDGTLRLSTSSFEAGSLTASPEQVENTQTLGKKKRSILGIGLGLPSSMRLPTARGGSTTSSIFLQPNRPSVEGLGNRPKERMGSTISTASSLRPISMASSSGASASTRESRGSVKWDEEGLQSGRREIQKEKKEKRKKKKEREREEGVDSKRLSDGKRRISITDVFPEVTMGEDLMDVDRQEEIHKRFSTAFPIVTIEEATTDGHDDESDNIHDSLVYGGILKEDEKKDSPQTTPVKRQRVRPMSEQLLGKARPRAVYEDDEGVLSILDAATNDLAQLINNLDLEATPNTPDLTPLRPDFLDRSNATSNGSPVKRARLTTDSPLKDKSPSIVDAHGAKGLYSRPSVASITSLRPYAQSRGKATKTLATPVYTLPLVNDTTVRKRPSELEIGQPIKPWPVLLQQISPIKDRSVAKRSNKENVPSTQSPSKIGTWKKGHKRTMTPGPEPEPGPVFHPLRPPKSRIIRLSDALDGNATIKPSASSIFAPSTNAPKEKGLKGSASPPPSLGRRASAFLRKRCSLLPIPADISSGDASFSGSTSSSDNATSASGSVPVPVPAEKRRKRMPGTLGGSDVSCYAVPELDAFDPDSDIPDELQHILNTNNNSGKDDDTFDFSKRFVHDDDDSGDIERPRSILPPLEFPDLPSEILSAPIFNPSLSGTTDVLDEIDEGDHADVEFDPDGDTKKSFDFTGELRRLNESGASHRHSFVEQLENAFRTPATLDLRCDLGGLLQVEAPPVPRLPLDFNIGRRDPQVEEGTSAEQSGSEIGDEPEAFDILKVSRLVNVRDPVSFGLHSTEPDSTNIDNRALPNLHGTSRLSSTTEAASILDSSLEVDSAEVTGRIVVSADPTEELEPSATSSRPGDTRPFNGELNTSFKFGGLPRQVAPEQPSKADPPLTLSDIIPPPSHVRSLSASTASSELPLEDDSLFKSLLAKVSDPPQPRPKAISDADNQFLQARQSFYRHSQASSVSSFAGFDSFEEVRRGFEFNSERPGFYPPPSTNNQSRYIRDSVMSIASVSSYGHVINPGIPDPFDFGLPSLQERPLSENLSTMSFTVDDTFSFLNHASRRRRRVDSDASSFYFHAPASRPRDRRRESALSVASQAPPVSLYNRSFGAHRHNDSSGSTGSGHPRRHSHRFNNSTDSIVSDLSAMRLGRPGLGDKMFDVADQAMPLASISASPTDSMSESLSFQFRQPTFDSIMDDERRMSVDVSDSIFNKTGQRTSVTSDVSLFGRDDDACIQPGHLPSYQFRPLSFMSAHSVHSPVKDDDTMISMLGGGHVRRRSIGSIMAGSPCARVEKRKHSTFQDVKGSGDEYVTPNKTRRVEKPMIPSLRAVSEHVSPAREAQSASSGQPSPEESCFVGQGEDSSMSFRPVPVFTRPPPASRSRSSTCTSSFGGDTPPLSACDGASISGSSMSSFDLSDIDTMLSHSAYSISAREQVRSRARARGHGHRRRFSHVRSSRSGSVYETIQEELASADSSPAQSITTDKSTHPTKVFIVDSDTASIYSNPDESTSLWDDDRGITALRKYYALQDEVQSTVMESKRLWLDTPFSIFALQSFKPPHHAEDMKAMLEHSVENYGPLPSELRPSRARSRKDSRPSPYPQSRPVKPILSPELAPLSTHPEKASYPSSDPTPLVPLSSKLDNGSSLSHFTNPPSLCIPSVGNTNNTSSTEYMKSTVRPRVASNTRRTALGWTKRNGIKGSVDTAGVHGKLSAGANTASTNQKENIAGMGSIITSENSLRFNRPRPKGRPASASNAKPVQRPIRI